MRNHGPKAVAPRIVPNSLIPSILELHDVIDRQPYRQAGTILPRAAIYQDAVAAAHTTSDAVPQGKAIKKHPAADGERRP
jgi:hypothetical protein